MNATVIQSTMDLWGREPERAKGKPSVKARSEGSQAIM